MITFNYDDFYYHENNVSIDDFNYFRNSNVKLFKDHDNKILRKLSNKSFFDSYVGAF